MQLKECHIDLQLGVQDDQEAESASTIVCSKMALFHGL